MYLQSFHARVKFTIKKHYRVYTTTILVLQPPIFGPKHFITLYLGLTIKVVLSFLINKFPKKIF